MQNFCFRVVIFFRFEKSRFPTCSNLRFSDSLENPYPACKKCSFSNLFFGLLLSVFCLLRRVHLFVTHDLLSPFPFTIYGHLLACLWGVFHRTFSKNLPTIIGHLPYLLAGCFKKFTVIYYPSTTIGNFRHESKWFTRNFFLTEENLLTIYGHLHIVWRGIFGKN